MELTANSSYCVYYTFLDYWKQICTNHPSIGFVSQGDVFGIDNKEFPMYPLANIQIVETAMDSKVITHRMVLTVADKPKEIDIDSVDAYNKNTIPYEGINDVVDIHANTLGIITDLLAFTTKYGRFEVSNIRCIPFEDKFDNVLAGNTCSFDISMPNECWNACYINLL